MSQIVSGQATQHELTRLVDVSGALTAMIVTKEGNVVDEAGDTSYLNTTAMAALVAGMFSATREVAAMVGETQFSILLQQGENRHIHMSLVTDRMLMVVIFEDYQRIGRVRHEAKRSGLRLGELFRAKTRHAEGAGENLSTPEFKEYALNLIDRIFAPNSE